MGLILDILNIAPRVRKRASAGEDIREIFLEELNKEIAQSQVTNNKRTEHDTLTTNTIISEKIDIDNGYIWCWNWRNNKRIIEK